MSSNNARSPSAQVSNRDALLADLLDGISGLPDTQEVFNIVDAVRKLGGITADEAAMLMHLYWGER